MNVHIKITGKEPGNDNTIIMIDHTAELTTAKAKEFVDQIWELLGGNVVEE
jgi:hypothetical protein